MNKTKTYREALHSLTEWDPYLRENSGLPGPRANLELVHVVAEEASAEQVARWLEYTPERAPENTPDVFLSVCATVALGRILASGQSSALPQLRVLANDPRWRVREGVAMALQRLGDTSLDALLQSIRPWAAGTLLEQRAAAAAICEPRLLRESHSANVALDLLDQITTGIATIEDRRCDDFLVLRKSLGYCWSVVIAARPDPGKLRFAAWLASSDPSVRWILRENLKKNRLQKMDPAWVAEMKALLTGP